MSGERLSMRMIKEILRLKWDCDLSNRTIARSCGIGRATVSEYLHRAKAAGVSWPLDEQIDDARLERLLCYHRSRMDPSV
jgi:DNA-binding transcriptional regulator LsrR (DeoR family)